MYIHSFGFILLMLSVKWDIKKKRYMGTCFNGTMFIVICYGFKVQHTNEIRQNMSNERYTSSYPIYIYIHTGYVLVYLSSI